MMKSSVWMVMAGLAAAGAAHGQVYPVKPIRFIVGFGAGGGNDIIARMLGSKLTESMGQQVIVDNRPGGAGIVAANMAAKAPADGYTLFGGSISTLATNVSMHRRLPYDPLRDFAPVTTTTLSPYLLVIHPSLPAATLKEFIALAKSSARKFDYASAGAGSGNHLSHELFRSMTGMQLVHVPYKGAAEQTTALLGNEVQMSFIQVQVALTQARAGRLRALGITGAKRLTIAPDVPAIAEAVPGFEAISWQGVVVPSGTPRAIVDRLHREITQALRAPDIVGRLTPQGASTGGIAPADFSAFIRTEIAKWAQVVKRAGLQPQ